MNVGMNQIIAYWKQKWKQQKQTRAFNMFEGTNCKQSLEQWKGLYYDSYSGNCKLLSKLSSTFKYQCVNL